MAKQYLDKDGVQQVWNAVDSKFMRSSGTATRPAYNGNDLALYSDIPSTAKNLYMHNIRFQSSATASQDNVTRSAVSFSIISSSATAYTYNDICDILNSRIITATGDGQYWGNTAVQVIGITGYTDTYSIWITCSVYDGGSVHAEPVYRDYVTSFTDTIAPI